MPTREISTRFKLDGEQEFKKAMNDAANATKVLNSEQKLAKAQYEATGDAQQYAAEQTRILQEQIEQQKKAVKAAEDAVASLTKNGVDPNSRQMQTWRTRLNNARTSLVNMQTRLDKVGTELSEETTEFGNAENAAGSFQGQMEEVAKGVNLQNTLTALGKMTDTIEKGVKAAAKMAKSVWEMGVSGGKWADNIATEASKLGVDAETYQSWQYASRFIDTSVSDITKSWQDIQKNLDSSSSSYTDYLAMLAQMGIASRTAGNEMRSSQDIFWDAIDYLHGISDATEQAEKANKLFGSDWRNLNPLIESGSKAYKDLANEGRAVAVVSNENVAALAAVDDTMQDFQARAEKSKYDTLAELAPTFQTIAQAMGEAMTAWDDFVSSDEGRAALSEFNGALQGVVSSFLGEDGGKGKFATIVGDAKEVVHGFTGAMEWFGENGETVRNIISGMAIAWAGLKTTEEVLLFMQLLKAIPLAKLQALFGGGNAASAAGQALSGGAAAGGGAVIKSGGGLLSILKGATPVAGAAAVGYGFYKLVDTIDKQANKPYLDELESIQSAAEEAAESRGEEADAAMEIVNTAKEALGLNDKGAFDSFAIVEALNDIYGMETAGILTPKTRMKLQYQHVEGVGPIARDELLHDIMEDAANSVINPEQAESGLRASDALEAIRALQDEVAGADTSQNFRAMYELIDKLSQSEGVFANLSDTTKNLFGEFLWPESGLSNYEVAGSTYAQQLLQSIADDLAAGKDRWADDGKMIPEGLAQGIDDNADTAADAAENMTDGTTDAAVAALGARSGSSSVFENLGNSTGVGFASGIYKSGYQAIEAALWMAQGVEGITRRTLDIHSPSGVLEKDGIFTGEGFAGGIIKTKEKVDRAVSFMLSATRQKPAMSFSGVELPDATTSRRTSQGRAGGNQTSGMANVTIMIGERVVGETIAPIVNRTIGAQIQSTRR